MPVARKMRPDETTSTSVPTSVAPLLPTAHLVVLAAEQNDPAAKQLLASTLASANAGAADAVAVAQVYEHATKVKNRANYVRHWMYGDGAAKVRGR